MKTLLKILASILLGAVAFFLLIVVVALFKQVFGDYHSIMYYVSLMPVRAIAYCVSLMSVCVYIILFDD